MLDVPITVTDLQTFDDGITTAEATDMIATAWARAKQVAPCLKSDDVQLTDDDMQIVKDVLRSAILRWHDRGSGAIYQRTAGDYGETIVTRDPSLFRPNEIRDLKEVCGNARRRGAATTILPIPQWATTTPTVHPFRVSPLVWWGFGAGVRPSRCVSVPLLRRAIA